MGTDAWIHVGTWVQGDMGTYKIGTYIWINGFMVTDTGYMKLCTVNSGSYFKYWFG